MIGGRGFATDAEDGAVESGRSLSAARYGNVRVELKCSNGKEMFPRALIRAREQSVRAEIPPSLSPGDSAQLGR